MSLPKIAKGELKVGMYVDLGLSWFDHPFASARFKITDAATLAQIQALRKLSTVTWDPDKSDLDKAAESGPADDVQEAAAVISNADADADARDALKSQRSALNKTESKVRLLNQRVRNLMGNLTSGSEIAIAAAGDIAGEVTDDLVSDPNAVMQLINLSAGDDSSFGRHAINVTAMSVMLARAAELDDAQVHSIGLGAFLHDIGTTRLPKSLTLKKSELNAPESRLYQEHCRIGLEIMGDNAAAIVRQIIACHHERCDGKGSPRGLGADKIPVAAKIVALANRYDHLCNPSHGRAPLAPSDAIKYLFAKERAHFDKRLLDLFVKCLGVYPPGTLVGLNNDQIGIVVQSNPAAPLKPLVVVYDPVVKRTDAVPLDLSAHGALSVERSYVVDQLPDVISSYLALSARTHYYLVSAVDSEILAAGERLRDQTAKP
ncbi:HD-GYP domain-containing protein [Litorivicinus lipolyticus]|nr:HD-GYP domain-containing protein [Litorivicinus lipolyticus]